MFEEEQNLHNKNEQSEELLTPAPLHEISIWKRITLFAVGLFGVQLFGLIISLFAINAPKDAQPAIVNFVTYSILFAILAGLIVLDIPKLLYKLKNWKHYLIGLGFGVGIILFDIFYTTIVSSFYTFSVNQNEQGIRSIVAVYPIASIFIFGIIGPVCEELTYRVGLFSAINKKNKIVAYIVTILVFGFIHFSFKFDDPKKIIDELVCLPMYLASGFLLTFAYDKFGFPCSTVAHITNNLWSVLGQIILKAIGGQ